MARGYLSVCLVGFFFHVAFSIHFDFLFGQGLCECITGNTTTIIYPISKKGLKYQII